MTTPEIKQEIEHYKWVQSRSLIGLNRVRSATYFAFNVWRGKYGSDKLRNI